MDMLRTGRVSELKRNVIAVTFKCPANDTGIKRTTEKALVETLHNEGLYLTGLCSSVQK